MLKALHRRYNRNSLKIEMLFTRTIDVWLKLSNELMKETLKKCAHAYTVFMHKSILLKHTHSRRSHTYTHACQYRQQNNIVSTERRKKWMNGHFQCLCLFKPNLNKVHLFSLLFVLFCECSLLTIVYIVWFWLCCTFKYRYRSLKSSYRCKWHNRA